MNINSLAASVTIGFASGLRSTMGLLAFAHAKLDGTEHADLGRAVVATAVVAESAVDKLPTTPSRLQMPGLIARVAAGGLGAYGLADTPDRSARAIAVAIGCAGALAGSYAGAAYRTAASKKVPPLAAAVAEDIAANALAYASINV